MNPSAAEFRLKAGLRAQRPIRFAPKPGRGAIVHGPIVGNAGNLQLGAPELVSPLQLCAFGTYYKLGRAEILMTNVAGGGGFRPAYG